MFQLAQVIFSVCFDRSVKLKNKDWSVISGFCREVAENLALLGHYATSTSPRNDPEERGSQIKPELSYG